MRELTLNRALLAFQGAGVRSMLRTGKALARFVGHSCGAIRCKAVDSAKDGSPLIDLAGVF